MSTYYTIMSMIDGFKSFINLAVMVLTIVASWIMYAKAGEHGWAAIVLGISCGKYRKYSRMYFIDV